jgi:hypothetical protein
VEVCLACEPNGSDGCRRENLLHPLLRCFDRVWRGWLGDLDRVWTVQYRTGLAAAVHSQSISETECLGYKGFTAGNVPEIIYVLL